LRKPCIQTLCTEIWPNEESVKRITRQGYNIARLAKIVSSLAVPGKKTWFIVA
jgi:hypothetical protein